jgi:hypothetical protein
MSGRNQGREAATAGPRAAARSARFRFGDTVGSHCCPRPDDEHPLQTYVAAAKGPDGEAGMERLFDGFLAAHSINIEAEPTPDAVEAMQRLLDGVPERWRDADLA